MQKTVMNEVIGSYELELDLEKTRAYYDALPVYEGEDLARRLFCHLLPKANQESLSFLRKLGIDPTRLFFARPLCEPDENGQVLFLCYARLCGVLKAGGDTVPRQSEEVAGLSVVFVGHEKDFCQGLPDAASPQIEMRFVISLPFDETFFK